MQREFAGYVRRRWWFVTVVALLVLVIVLAVLALQAQTKYAHVSHFVLHPDSRSSVADATNSVDVSGQDGPLVQTLRRVLSSDEMLRRAVDRAGVGSHAGVHSSAAVAPGTAYFDATVTAPSPEVAAAVGRAFDAVVPQYVEASYRGFAFDVLGSDESKVSTFPPGVGVIALVLALGAAAAVVKLWALFALRARRSMATAAETGEVEEIEGIGAAAAPPPVVERVPKPRRGAARARAKPSQPDPASHPVPVPAKGRRGRARAARWRAPAAS
jgi:capsular polysaccharide biosynthesis protein